MFCQKFRNSLTTAFVSFVAAFGFSGAASAATLSIDLDYVFSSSGIPDSSSPYMTAVFDDGGVAGSVSLTLTGSMEEADEFISQFYFNVDETIGDIAITNNSKPSGDATPTVSPVAFNTYKADGGGMYDALIDFGTSAGTRFDGTDVYSFNITGTGIVATSFEFWAERSGGNGQHMAAAHLQGIEGGCSAWVGGGVNPSDDWDVNDNCSTPEVPLPAGLSLMLTGLAGVGGVAAYRRRRQAS